VLPLTNVSFIDSMAVGLLVSMKQRVSDYGGSSSVNCEQPPVRLVLDMVGLIEYLNVDLAE
jgi:anti-anti-sigma factor